MNWLEASAMDHSITNYISILGSDLKISIESYLNAGKITSENSQKIMEYLDLELRSIKASHSDL